jgi:Flp pilus assembly protein TadG
MTAHHTRSFSPRRVPCPAHDPMPATAGEPGCARAGERGGGSSVEAAIGMIGFALLIALIIAAGRLVLAEAAADHAARAAARIASLQRDAGPAQQVAEDTARAVLAAEGLTCQRLDVVVDVSGFDQPLGEPAVTTATVTCAVRWSDLGLPGADTRLLEAQFISPIDRLRERT